MYIQTILKQFYVTIYHPSLYRHTKNAGLCNF